MLHLVNHHQSNLACAFWKCPTDLLVVNDDVPHHRPAQKCGIQIRLLKPNRETLTKCRCSTGQQLGWMLKHLRILGISCQKCVKVSRIESIKLSLHHSGWVI